MRMKYNRADLTDGDVCKHCGKDLRKVDEIHVVEGMHFCRKFCAVEWKADDLKEHSKTNGSVAEYVDDAKEWYSDYAEVVTPMDIGLK